jgi:uncharacterized protein YdiU (UPF0061 family)
VSDEECLDQIQYVINEYWKDIKDPNTTVAEKKALEWIRHILRMRAKQETSHP